MCDIDPIVMRAHLRELERQAAPQSRPVPRAPAARSAAFASLLRWAATSLRRIARQVPVVVSRR
jgi:hypothetical protein